MYLMISDNVIMRRGAPFFIDDKNFPDLFDDKRLHNLRECCCVVTSQKCRLCRRKAHNAIRNHSPCCGKNDFPNFCTSEHTEQRAVVVNKCNCSNIFLFNISQHVNRRRSLRHRVDWRRSDRQCGNITRKFSVEITNLKSKKFFQA